MCKSFAYNHLERTFSSVLGICYESLSDTGNYWRTKLTILKINNMIFFPLISSIYISILIHNHIWYFYKSLCAYLVLFIETFTPVRAEQEYRGESFFEVLPTLYRNQNHRMMRTMVALNPHEGSRPASYMSRDGIHPSPRYAAEYCAAHCGE